MGEIQRTVHVRHDSGQQLGGLLHYVVAASNHTARGYRRGARGKDLYHMAVHHTGVYQTRFADYIIRGIHGDHKAWRTRRLADPHARAPHYHNGVAQTDQFELAFDKTSKRWNGSPAIHVAVYGRGRKAGKRCADCKKCERCKSCSDCKKCEDCKNYNSGEWVEFRVPPYVVERLTAPGVIPKTVRLGRDQIAITYEMAVEDREPAMWAGMDMNAKNNTYAYANGMTSVVHNEYHKWYNAAHSKILKVKRRGDRRIMAKYAAKAWGTYKNRAKDHIGKEAKAVASTGCAIGFEELTISKMYTKNGKTAPYVRGKMKTTLNTGQRRRAVTNALDAEGLPHESVDPAGTSAKCLGCGKRLGRAAVQQSGARNMWCQPCRKVRERDGNGSANILFRTILALVIKWTGMDGEPRGITLPGIASALREAISHPNMTAQQRSTLSNIMRLLEGRSAGAEWRPPGAHKPGRRNPARGERVDGPGVGGPGRNGPGPPNAAKLCARDYA